VLHDLEVDGVLEGEAVDVRGEGGPGVVELVAAMQVVAGNPGGDETRGRGICTRAEDRRCKGARVLWIGGWIRHNARERYL